MQFSKEDIAEFKRIIEQIIDAKLASKRLPSYVSALVTSVDDNGYISVMIPPDTSRELTGLLNKTGEQLKPGDSVEIATKNGSLSNAWISIKHGNSKYAIKK